MLVKLSNHVNGSEFNSDMLVENLARMYDNVQIEVDIELPLEKYLDLNEAAVLSPFNVKLFPELTQTDTRLARGRWHRK